jgi:hypothetical protein
MKGETMAKETKDPIEVYGVCEVCASTITVLEDMQLNRDIDFVEHLGHTIRRVRGDDAYRARARRGLGNYYGR